MDVDSSAVERFVAESGLQGKKIKPVFITMGSISVTKLVEATNGHSLVEAENAICYDIVRGYGLRRSLFWRRGVFFHGTKKQKTSVHGNG